MNFARRILGNTLGDTSTSAQHATGGPTSAHVAPHAYGTGRLVSAPWEGLYVESNQ